MSAVEPLLDRVREELAAERDVREVRMFGGVSFMVGDSMVVAGGRARRLARVEPDRDAELVERPGARRAEMGAGRDMGAGWIHVDADAIESDTELRFWIAAALDRNHRAAR